MEEYRSLIRSLYGDRAGKRVILEEALESLEDDVNPFYIIRAPTGYGKTSFTYTLLSHALKDSSRFEKVIHVLPMRSIAHDIYERASKHFNLVGRQMMGVHETPFLLRPLSLTTIDTFTYDFMKLNTIKLDAVKEGREYGYDYFTQASIALSAVVFDEAHMVLEVDSLAEAFLTVLKGLMSMRTPIFLMSATVSRGYAMQLGNMAERMGYSFRLFPEFDKRGIKDDFFIREARKKFEIRVEDGKPEDLVVGGRRNLIVVNTVDEAQRVYLALKDRGFDPLLLHSRFKPSDRERLMEELSRIKKMDEWILVSTQVIEAGVDVSSDVLITELAPPTSLIQRMGRNARFEGDERGSIYILRRETCLPYSPELCNSTLEALNRLIGMGRMLDIHPRNPSTYQGLIDEVYPALKAMVNERLWTFLMDPLVRSSDMINKIRQEIRRGGFLREYPVPLKVGDEEVPINRRILEKLSSSGKVEIREDGAEWREAHREDVVRGVMKLAFWEEVEFRLKEEWADRLYSKEMGLRVGDD